MSPYRHDPSAWAIDFASGLSAGLVGVWLADALSVLDAWILLLAGVEIGALGDAKPSVALSAHDHWALHAVTAFGDVLGLAVAFVLALLAARKISGMVGVLSASVAFWTAVPVMAELVRLVWDGRGHAATLIQSVGLPIGGEIGQSMIAVAASVGIIFGLASTWRRQSVHALWALALPTIGLGLLWPAARLQGDWFERVGLNWLPTALAAVVCIASLRRLDESPPIGLKACVSLAVVGAFALAVPVPEPQFSTAPREISWTRAQSGGWNVRFEDGRFSVADREAWTNRADARLAAWRERLGMANSETPLGVHVVATERAFRDVAKVRRGGDAYFASVDGPAVLLASPDPVPEDPRSEPLIAMLRHWGPPASTAVALAIARYALGGFRGSTLAEAAERIVCEEGGHSVATVLGADDRFRSPLSRDALAGEWVRRVVERHGTGALAQLYRLPVAEAITLCPDCTPVCREESVPARPMATDVGGYWKGVSFSHEVRGGRGYGTESAGRELHAIADSGANAIALVPYAFTRAPDETSIRTRTLETDVRLQRSVRQARSLGLKILLKPHLWAGPRFHGDIAFEDKGRFDTWFDDYRRWMLHFARFAEVHSLDGLSVGNELAGLTVHENDWRSLIADVRRIYRGPVTYSAHWREEVERVGFWDSLDWIGVNFYFPIADRGDRPAVDAPKIRSAARRIEELRGRFDKPILFTEVGFPALATAAVRPWEENASALDTSLQAECYAAWFETFAEFPGVKGMFWWKWRSDGRGGPFDTSHSPVGKPALTVLQDWFGRL